MDLPRSKRLGVLPFLLPIFLFAALLSGCATTAPASQAGAEQAPPVTYPPYTGPKKRIAVAKFDAAGNFVAVYGGWDIGGGLSAQLVTELLRTGRFIVVERAELAPVLREQEMGMTKIVGKETAAQVGKVLGAQLLIMGSVTEFEQRAGGGGFGLGVGGFPIAGALGLQTVSGHLGMDLRLVETTTGQIVQSHRAEATTSATGIVANINVQQVSFGGDVFQKTPLGMATRQAIQNAVAFIIAQMEKVPWTGRVVDIIGGKIYINAGADTNIKPGDTFTVSAVVKELTDPSTGISLGAIEDRLGEIQVEAVQEKFAITKTLAPFIPKRGDLVRLK